MALHPGVKLWTIGFNECRMTNGGFARAAQALAPRVALSFYNRPFDKRLTTGRSTKDSRQAVRQKTHDRPFDKRLTTGRSTKDSRQAVRRKAHDRQNTLFDVRSAEADQCFCRPATSSIGSWQIRIYHLGFLTPETLYEITEIDRLGLTDIVVAGFIPA